MKNIRYLLFWVVMTTIAALPTSAANYDQKIIGYLNEALQNPDVDHGNNYLPLFNYLRSQEKDPSFKASLRSRHLRLNLNAQPELRSGQAQIYHKKQRFTKLPVYPILSDGVATVASFIDLNDKEFLDLPVTLREYYRSLYEEAHSKTARENTNPPGNKVTQVIPFEQLKELAPEYTKGQYWLVSPGRGVLGQLDSMHCSTWIESGQYQIDLRFKNRVNNTLFAFHSQSGGVIPNVIYPQILPRQMPPGLTRRGIVAVPVAPRSTVVYIASINNTHGNFNFLWDWKSKRLLYFDMGFGYSLGNEHEELARNYLLEYKNRFYLLRNADDLRYSELVYFSRNDIERDPLADFRATEI